MSSLYQCFVTLLMRYIFHSLSVLLQCPSVKPHRKCGPLINVVHHCKGDHKKSPVSSKSHTREISPIEGIGPEPFFHPFRILHTTSAGDLWPRLNNVILQVKELYQCNHHNHNFMYEQVRGISESHTLQFKGLWFEYVLLLRVYIAIYWCKFELFFSSPPKHLSSREYLLLKLRSILLIPSTFISL